MATIKYYQNSDSFYKHVTDCDYPAVFKVVANNEYFVAVKLTSDDPTGYTEISSGAWMELIDSLKFDVIDYIENEFVGGYPPVLPSPKKPT